MPRNLAAEIDGPTYINGMGLVRSNSKAPDGAPALLPLLNPADWQGQEVPSREWAWADYIPHRQATYLTGPGSPGKSLLSQQLCTCIGRRSLSM